MDWFEVVVDVLIEELIKSKSTCESKQSTKVVEREKSISKILVCFYRQTLALSLVQIVPEMESQVTNLTVGRIWSN